MAIKYRSSLYTAASGVSRYRQSDHTTHSFKADSSEAFFESYATRRIAERGSWLIGGSYTNLRGDAGGTINLPHYDLSWWNFYSQASLPMDDHYTAHFGAQYNKAQGLSAVVTPRIGASYRIDTQRGIKLLYSEAFRSPFPAETDVQAAPVLTGNPNLEPEFVKTLDLRYRQEHLVAFGPRGCLCLVWKTSSSVPPHADYARHLYQPGRAPPTRYGTRWQTAALWVMGHAGIDHLSDQR